MQQSAEEHHIGPLIALGVNDLDLASAWQQMSIAPGHGREQHFNGVRQQAARVGVVVRFGGRH